MSTCRLLLLLLFTCFSTSAARVQWGALITLPFIPQDVFAGSPALDRQELCSPNLGNFLPFSYTRCWDATAAPHLHPCCAICLPTMLNPFKCCQKNDLESLSFCFIPPGCHFSDIHIRKTASVSTEYTTTFGLKGCVRIKASL